MKTQINCMEHDERKDFYSKMSQIEEEIKYKKTPEKIQKVKALLQEAEKFYNLVEKNGEFDGDDLIATYLSFDENKNKLERWLIQ